MLWQILRLLDIGILHINETQARTLSLGNSAIRVHLSEVPMGRLKVDGGYFRCSEHRHHFRCFIFPDVGLAIHTA